MDHNEYLSIKYKICLKNGETCLPSSSAVPNGQLSEGQRSSTQYDPYKNDQSVYIQQWQYSKYRETTSSSQQPSPVVIPSPSTGTRVGLADSFSKSSHTDYFRDIDPCSNCSNLLIRAAEFLTKIELNYERPTTVPSNLSTSTQKEDNIPHRPISAFDNKVIPIRLPSVATHTTNMNKSNESLINMQRKRASELTINNVSQLEEDIITPLEWMFSSKEKWEKREKDNIVQDEMNIKSKLTKNREKRQVKRKAAAKNSLMTLDTAKLKGSAAEGMQSELEKDGKAIAAETLKLKDISKNDGEKVTDDKQNVINSVKSRRENKGQVE